MKKFLNSISIFFLLLAVSINFTYPNNELINIDTEKTIVTDGCYKDQSKGLVAWIKANPKKTAAIMAFIIFLGGYGTYKLFKKDKKDAPKNHTIDDKSKKNSDSVENKANPEVSEPEKDNSNLQYELIWDEPASNKKDSSDEKKNDSQADANKNDIPNRPWLNLNENKTVDPSKNMSKSEAMSEDEIDKDLKGEISQEEAALLKTVESPNDLIEKFFPGKYTDKQKVALQHIRYNRLYRKYSESSADPAFNIKGLSDLFIHSRTNDLVIPKDAIGNATGEEIRMSKDEYMKMINLFVNRSNYCKQQVLESPSVKVALDLASDKETQEVLSNYSYNSRRYGEPLRFTLDELTQWEIEELDKEIERLKDKKNNTIFPHIRNSKGETAEIYMDGIILFSLLKQVKAFKEKNK